MNFPCGFALVVLLLITSNSQAETFVLGANINGFTGAANTTLNAGVFGLSLTAGPTGSLLNETAVDGMGIDSSTLAGAVDSSASKLNILAGAAAGQGESIRFTFDTAGVLEELRFDGLKDETLEYFSLELPNGNVLSLFDFEVELRLNQQGFQLSELGVPSPTQADGPSDNFTGLGIPFIVGEEFRLTYGEIDYDGAVLPGYFPRHDDGTPTGDLPNGARFQGLVMNVVPEPSSLVLLAIAQGLAGIRRRYD